MSTAPTTEARVAPFGTSATGRVVVAVQGRAGPAVAAAREVEDRLRGRFGAWEPVVLVTAAAGGAVTLRSPGEHGDAAPRGDDPLARSASEGAVPAHASALGPLLRAASDQDARAVAIVAAEPHDHAVDWLGRLLAPIIEDGYDFVCPAYARHRTEGAINTGIVSPLFRTLYGVALRQPLGAEAALSGALARRLLDDADWSRRPAQAGSDAWLIAKVLEGGARVAQSWLGAWPRPQGEPEEPSETLVRALGLVFGEMERTAGRWQRTGRAVAAPTFGEGGFVAPGGARPDPARLFEAFALGLRDLQPVLGLVLPPATILELQQAARSARPIPDALWARVIFDFAVAHLVRAVERRQLLRSLTPLYLGWLAGLVRDAGELDDAAFEARAEAVGAAFEREKPYLVARWRWPDEFNP